MDVPATAGPRLDTRGLVASGPAAAALGLVVLYACGVLLEATRLHGAHVNVRDTLPLIPLPSLLTLGIGVMTTAIGFLAAFAVFFGLLGWVAWREAKRPPVKRGGERSGRHALWLVLFAVLFLAVIVVQLILTATPPELLGGLLLALGGMATGVAAGRRRPRAALQCLVVTYLALIAVGLLKAYVYPAPLPKVRLVGNNGSPTSGRLIVHTDGLWYVVPAHQRVVALPDAHVARAEIILQKPEHHRTTGQLLRDLFR
jgi:hypothetical protein